MPSSRSNKNSDGAPLCKCDLDSASLLQSCFAVPRTIPLYTFISCGVLFECACRAVLLVAFVNGATMVMCKFIALIVPALCA